MIKEENLVPNLTRKEARLIKLLRMQSEDNLEKILKKASKTNYDDSEHEESESSNAFWLNSDYYKK